MAIKQEHFKQAIELAKHFEQLSFKDQQQFETHALRIGCVYNIVGQYEEALEILRKVIPYPNKCSL